MRPTGRAPCCLAADSTVDLVAGDLLDWRFQAALFDRAGNDELLVNNAAHCEVPDTVAEVGPESLDRHFAVNAQASALLMAPDDLPSAVETMGFEALLADRMLDQIRHVQHHVGSMHPQLRREPRMTG